MALRASLRQPASTDAAETPLSDSAAESAAGEDVLQIGEGLVPVEARRLDQAHDRRSPFAGTERAGKEPVLAADGNRPDLVVDPVIVDGHAPVGQAMGQRRPAFQGVVDGLRAG